MRATFLIFASMALAGCDVPYEVDPNFGADSTVDSGTAETDTAVDTGTPSDGGCKDNLDCAGRLDTPLCNITLGKCVACLTSDRCAKGQYCKTDTGECVAGCRDDSDCTTPTTGDAGPKTDAGDASVTPLKCDLESDGTTTFVGAHIGRETTQAPFQIYDERVVVVALDGAGSELGRFELPPPIGPEEQFKTMVISPKGEIHHLFMGSTGASIRRAR